MKAKKMMATLESTETKQVSIRKVQALLPYSIPEVTLLGKVEQLTGALRRGTPDLLGHGNIL
jgi:hypothetical protein